MKRTFGETKRENNQNRATKEQASEDRERLLSTLTDVVFPSGNLSVTGLSTRERSSGDKLIGLIVEVGFDQVRTKEKIENSCSCFWIVTKGRGRVKSEQITIMESMRRFGRTESLVKLVGRSRWARREGRRSTSPPLKSILRRNRKQLRLNLELLLLRQRPFQPDHRQTASTLNDDSPSLSSQTLTLTLKLQNFSTSTQVEDGTSSQLVQGSTILSSDRLNRKTRELERLKRGRVERR